MTKAVSLEKISTRRDADVTFKAVARCRWTWLLSHRLRFAPDIEKDWLRAWPESHNSMACHSADVRDIQISWLFEFLWDQGFEDKNWLYGPYLMNNFKQSVLDGWNPQTFYVVRGLALISNGSVRQGIIFRCGCGGWVVDVWCIFSMLVWFSSHICIILVFFPAVYFHLFWMNVVNACNLTCVSILFKWRNFWIRRLHCAFCMGFKQVYIYIYIYEFGLVCCKIHFGRDRCVPVSIALLVFNRWCGEPVSNFDLSEFI